MSERLHRLHRSPLGLLRIAVALDAPAADALVVADPAAAATGAAGGPLDALVGIWFDGQKHHPRPDALGREVGAGAHPVLDAAAAQLDQYVAGERRSFDLPLRPPGPALHRQVWALLLAIPYGETTTYGALARALGSPGLAQAVGGGVGHNPVSIVIPCHRVIGADGSLTGYAGGLDRKRALLDLEEPEERRAARLF